MGYRSDLPLTLFQQHFGPTAMAFPDYRPPESRFTESISRETARRGALVRAVGNSIILSPPLIIEEREIDVIVRALAGALGEVSGP